MRSWFCFGFLALAVSSLSLGCERAEFREAREEEERFGGVNLYTGPEQPSLAEELGEEK